MRVPYAVYMLWSAALQKTYVGMTTNVNRRVAQHNGLLPGGAKFTRAGRPWTLCAQTPSQFSRSDAQRMEYATKQKKGRQARLLCMQSFKHINKT